MHIDIPQAQINFFHEHHFLELEEYLTPDQANAIKAILETTIDRTSYESAYLTGRDLWRKNGAIKKLVTSRELAQIAATLTQKKPLQLGFDQVLSGKSPKAQSKTLIDISNISTPVCGLLINLGHHPGSLTFFDREYPIPFDTFDDLFLLIVYTEINPRSVEKKGDPHKNHLKGLGYAFGDTLRFETHPLLIK